MIQKDMITLTSSTVSTIEVKTHKQRISKKFLGFALRTFKDLLSLGSDLNDLRERITKKEFNEYLAEEFRGSRYLAQTALAVHSWSEQLSKRTKSHILSAGSIRTLSNWSLAALRQLPKLGEGVVRSLLKLGAVSVKKIRQVAGYSTKPKKPGPSIEVLEQKLCDCWSRLQSLEVTLADIEPDCVSREALEIEIEAANKQFAWCAGKLKISIAEALRRVKGEEPEAAPQELETEIKRRTEEAIALKKIEIEEIVTQTRQQAEKEIAMMNQLRMKYQEENLKLRNELQELQKATQEREAYKQQLEALRAERDELARQLKAAAKATAERVSEPSDQSGNETPERISREEWEKLQNRQKEAKMTANELAAVALEPYDYSRGGEILKSQLKEVWERLEEYIKKNKTTLENKTTSKKSSQMTMTRPEAEEYSRNKYGPGSEWQEQRNEVEVLKSYNPGAVRILKELKDEASKRNLELRELVGNPFSVCVFSKNSSNLLAKLSLAVTTKVLQVANNIDGQLGRTLPVSSIKELMENLQRSQNKQLNLDF
jgi:chromosome segregation ATPase